MEGSWENTFIPDKNSKISEYKVKQWYKYRQGTCDFGENCHYFHENWEKRKWNDPLPYSVKKLYAGKPGNKRGPNKVIFEDQDYEHYQPKNMSLPNVQGKKGKSQYDARSTQARSQTNENLKNLQADYTNLKSKADKLEEENKELQAKIQAFETSGGNEAQIIATMDILKDENKQLKSKLQTPTTKQLETLKSIVLDIEEISRSPLSQNLIYEATLSPSLDVICKKDVKMHLDPYPEHPYLLKKVPLKNNTFKPIQNLVDLRKKLKDQYKKMELLFNNASEVVETQVPQVSQVSVVPQASEAPDDKKSELMAEIKILHDENLAQKKEIESLNKSLKELKIKSREYDELLTKHNKENAQLKRSHKEISSSVKEFVQSLKKEATCPILQIPMEVPVLTPSGSTVDESVMEELIKSKGKDPFDRNYLCKEKIVNRFASRVIGLINSYERQNKS